MSGRSDRPARPATTTTLSRTYGIPFSEVWQAALSVISSLRGWKMNRSDPRAGTIHFTTLHSLGRRPLDSAVRLWLDDLGQTWIEISVEESRHPLLPASGSSRARRFLRHLERALGVRGGR